MGEADARGVAVLRERLDDGVEVLRLDRPDKRNALDTATTRAVNAALDELAADAALRVLVLSTTNPRALCAGADLGEALDHAGGVARMAEYTRMYTAVEQFPVPTIAVCVGNVVGAGAELAAGADLRVGGDNLKLTWPGGRLGVPVGPARLAPLVGVAVAKDWILTGRPVGMEEAAAAGFLQRTAAAESAEAVALELAAHLAQQSAPGLRVLKQMFRDLDAAPRRVGYENALLMDFQRGTGIPTDR